MDELIEKVDKELEALMPSLRKREDIVNELVEDLKRLGFDDPDEPVEGSECIATMCRYYNLLAGKETFPEGAAACPVCGSVYLDSDEAASCCPNRRH